MHDAIVWRSSPGHLGADRGETWEFGRSVATCGRRRGTAGRTGLRPTG